MCTVGNYVYTCGIDDSVKQIDAGSKSYTGVETKLASQPRGLDLKGDTIVAASVKEVINLDLLSNAYCKFMFHQPHLLLQITVVQNGSKVSSLPISYESSCVSISPLDGETFVAVGGATDNKVKFLAKKFSVNIVKVFHFQGFLVSPFFKNFFFKILKSGSYLRSDKRASESQGGIGSLRASH